MRASNIDRAAIAAEALSRATTNQSFANWPAIIVGFTAKGIAEADILPRVNVFTFQAWKALGRHVRKGEHGVRVVTFVPCTKTVTEAGEEKTIGYKRPWSATVFHVSQTDASN